MGDLLGKMLLRILVLGLAALLVTPVGAGDCCCLGDASLGIAGANTAVCGSAGAGRCSFILKCDDRFVEGGSGTCAEYVVATLENGGQICKANVGVIVGI